MLRTSHISTRPASEERKTLQTPAIALAFASAWLGVGGSAQAQDAPQADTFGQDVVNVATIEYTVGSRTATMPTNEAVFTIRPPDTPAKIEFFRYAPTATDPIYRTINGSDYSPSGQLDGPFQSIGAPVSAGGQLINLSDDIPLIEAQTYLAGELMFIRVTDQSANRDSREIDTISITVTASNGDMITLRLYESAKNSGEFFAYLPSTAAPTQENDNMISAAGNTSLTATYIDAFDATDVVVDSAVLNPLNRVFSSADGLTIDAATVTLINVDTGERATVYGVDGFSTFPAEVISGSDYSDSSGLFYDNNDGEFRYPLLDAGNYIIEVEPPEGFRFASATDAEELADALAEMTGSRPEPLRSGRAEGGGSFAVGGFVLTPGSYGQVFTLNEPGPLRFDIPLDPRADLVVEKTVDRRSGDVGDYINYTVTITNEGTSLSPGVLHDTLPVGFRYVSGTSRLERAPTNDPNVSDDATLLTFDIDPIAPGETVRLDYALQIAPGAVFGTAVNEAVVIGPGGLQLSNVGRAAIELREDLLRSRSTIIGRVTEQSCQGEDDWARPIERGIGVSGVRLYMETGAYAVSDGDGLFHFEGVTKGTHVVQVDRETLPQGFELMKCEETTRHAGSMESQFVDVQGGGIWRANFYLKRVADIEEDVEESVFNDKTAYKTFDLEWLDTQNDTPSIAYPSVDRTPSQKATHVGIKHGADQSVSLQINGRDVPSYLFTGAERSTDGLKKLSRFKAVPIEDGRNVLIATVHDADGAVVTKLRQEIHYVSTIARIAPLPDQSVLVADGRTTPEVAIRFEDEAGRPVHGGRITEIEVEPPYRFEYRKGRDALEEQADSLIDPLSARRDFTVGADGTIRVALEPTLRTGKVTINARTDSDRIVPVTMYLQPEARDWILVALAEGTAAYDRVMGNATNLIANGANPDSVPSDDVISDGRIAFFAKGMIKGEWLMTLSVDTDKRTGDRDGDFLGEIDTNAYYTLYGDRSYQQFEGVSRYPVYLKLEKKQAYALFGDFDTNIQEGRLTAYNRRLSGLKAEYVGDTFQVAGFAAETNQGFVKDELAADGTSGLYQLSSSHILAQSEEVIIETRDRVRPDVVLERKTLVRYLDYTLDYLTGELLFRLPVDATDAQFNPNVIVVDYETSHETERNLTYGGRVQATLADDRVRIGSTFVHEDGSAFQAGAEADQIGVDALVQLSETTQARVEYAVTDSNAGPSADALLVEMIHTSDRVAAEAYYREEEDGFGLGQTGSGTNGVRRYGAQASVRVSESDDEETGARTLHHMEASAYREENLQSGDARDSADILFTQDGPRLDASAGLRVARDELVGRDDRESILALGRLSYEIPKYGATIQLSYEQPLGGEDSVSAYPMRTSVGIDKRIGASARVSLRHDRLDGEFARSDNTVVGLDFAPWSGGQVSASSDLVMTDSGRRIGATVGLDQQFRVDENWTISTGLRDRTMLDVEEELIEIAPDAAISPFEANKDFTSAYVGAGYNSAVTAGSVRFETRLSSASDTYIGSASVARALTEELSLAGTARIADSSGDSLDELRADMRLGGSWRPRDEGLVVFDRLDISHRETPERTETKVVNNIAANAMVTDRWQLTGNWGAKYTQATIAGQDFSNWTHLLGGETRFDVTRKIDIGARGQMMVNSDTSGVQYSYGPSIGVSPAKNIWISAGYNVEGFKDDDFEAAEYSRKGPYVTLRLKFDQNTARGLLRRISPSSIIARENTPASMLSQP